MIVREVSGRFVPEKARVKGAKELSESGRGLPHSMTLARDSGERRRSTMIEDEQEEAEAEDVWAEGGLTEGDRRGRLNKS